jgi:hypothetical protein
VNEKTKAFLRALEALCREHNATIDGCGCCDSPFVVVGDEDTGNVKVVVGEVWVGDDYCEKVKLDKPTLLVGRYPEKSGVP